MDQQLVSFLDALYSSKSTESKFLALVTLSGYLDFHGVFYMFVPSLRGKETVPDFLPHYLISSELKLMQLCNCSLPESGFVHTVLSVIAKDGQEGNVADGSRETLHNAPDQRDVATSDYKTSDCKLLVIETSDFGSAVIAVLSAEGEKHGAEGRQYAVRVMELACRVFHDHLCSNLRWSRPFYEPILFRLSNTERKVLRFVLSGGNIKKLPEIQVSERYGYNLLRKIRRRFGFRSTGEMLRRFTRIGMLELLHPYG